MPLTSRLRQAARARRLTLLARRTPREALTILMTRQGYVLTEARNAGHGLRFQASDVPRHLLWIDQLEDCSFLVERSWRGADAKAYPTLPALLEALDGAADL